MFWGANDVMLTGGKGPSICLMGGEYGGGVGQRESEADTRDASTIACCVPV